MFAKENMVLSTLLKLGEVLMFMLFRFAVCKLCDMQGNSASLLTMVLTRQACDSFWKENPGTVLMVINICC